VERGGAGSELMVEVLAGEEIGALSSAGLARRGGGWPWSFGRFGAGGVIWGR